MNKKEYMGIYGKWKDEIKHEIKFEIFINNKILKEKIINYIGNRNGLIEKKISNLNREKKMKNIILHELENSEDEI